MKNAAGTNCFGSVSMDLRTEKNIGIGNRYGTIKLPGLLSGNVL
jgi:hypothetical protein